MNPEKVFLDTGLFKAIIDENDDFYQQGKSCWKDLCNNAILLVTNNFILDESYTLIRTRCGIRKVFQFRNEFLAEQTQIQIERVTVEDEAEAWTWFEKDWKGLSFTDCVCFAMMKRLGIQRVATFDEHFRKAGFVCFP